MDGKNKPQVGLQIRHKWHCKNTTCGIAKINHMWVCKYTTNGIAKINHTWDCKDNPQVGLQIHGIANIPQAGLQTYWVVTAGDGAASQGQKHFWGPMAPPLHRDMVPFAITSHIQDRSRSRPFYRKWRSYFCR